MEQGVAKSDQEVLPRYVDTALHTLVRKFTYSSSVDKVHAAMEVHRMGRLQVECGLARKGLTRERLTVMILHPTLMVMYLMGQAEGRSWMKSQTIRPKSPF